MSTRITDNDVRILRAMKKWQEEFAGENVSSIPGSSASVGPGRNPPRPPQRRVVARFKITAVKDEYMECSLADDILPRGETSNEYLVYVAKHPDLRDAVTTGVWYKVDDEVIAIKVDFTTKVETVATDDAPAEDVQWVDAGFPTTGKLFVVNCTKDGGVAGDFTTDCTWTYTVKTLGNDAITTALSPTKPRIPKVTYPDVITSIGYGYYDSVGAFILSEVVEEIPGSNQVTFVTDYRVDTGSRKFQKKTQAVYVFTVGTESAWTDVHAGTAC